MKRYPGIFAALKQPKLTKTKTKKGGKKGD